MLNVLHVIFSKNDDVIIYPVRRYVNEITNNGIEENSINKIKIFVIKDLSTSHFTIELLYILK